jgi:Protein of unknown function (DUF3754)
MSSVTSTTTGPAMTGLPTADAARAVTAAPAPPPGSKLVQKPGHETAILAPPTVIPAGMERPDLPEIDIIAKHSDATRETFIPITKAALIDRLTHVDAWAPGQASQARKFFQYLDYWRRQSYSAGLRDVDKSYEAFNPDSDLLATRAFSTNERAKMQANVVTHVKGLLKQANYVQVDAKDLDLLAKGSHYGLDLHVDLKAFDELLVFYRGRSSKMEERREARKFYRKVEFEVPIFRRLFVLFKLKPTEQRVVELMRDHGWSRKEAERHVKKLRSLLSAQIRSDNIYMKLFKNMPRSDIEMIFPNTRVAFRRFDKIKLGLTSGGSVGMGMFGAAGKLALAASNPIAAIGAVAGLGGIAVRQGVNFMNQRQKYMVVMAQNLYFHAMADNRSAMIKLADRAAEEDFKEEMLLYCVLAKTQTYRHQLDDVDRGIENYLKNTFEIDVDFDLNEALGRLIDDGLVDEAPDGLLTVLQPADAALHIDAKWDVFLDNLIEDDTSLGVEVDD